MAQVLYVDNPADRTVTWAGLTLTYDFIDMARCAGVDPWGLAS